MRKREMLVALSLLMALAWTSRLFAAVPTYQPPPAVVIASGITDTEGPGGVGFIEYWVHDGGDGYFYYSYRIHNELGNSFDPFIKHLTIANPTGEPYVVTSSSGGFDLGGIIQGSAWSFATHASLPTLVDWVSNDPCSVIYPGQSSWDDPLFQFASILPPTSASVTIREGSLSQFANGLIPAPGNAWRIQLSSVTPE